MNDYKIAVKNSVNEEQLFYSGYEWCLNPILKLKDLFRHLINEFDRYNELKLKWQLEESKINIYLHCCAVLGIVEDYILWRPFELQPLIRIYPQFKFIISTFQFLLNLPYSFLSFNRTNNLFKLKNKWKTCVDYACNLLVKNDEITIDEIYLLRTKCLEIMKFFSGNVLERRMKLNEGFRCQDLTHYDILAITDKYLTNNRDKESEYVIIGSRTAGSYFAPLIKVYLQSKGFNKVKYITVRHKKGLSRQEKKELRKFLSPGSNVILTDDYSNTGYTFKSLQNIIWKFGANPEKTTLLAPIHPRKKNVKLSDSSKVEIIKLNHNELYKIKLLDTSFVRELLNEYFAENEFDEIKLTNNSFIDLKNINLQKQYTDSFQVRVKKVFEFYFENENGIITKDKVLFKSTGWGWLGYHAYIAGKKLNTFVPDVFGFRNGFVIEQWIEGNIYDHKPVPGNELKRISSYIDNRTKNLKLNEDPRFNKNDAGWGWMEILSILRRVYGVRTGYLKNNTLRKHLAKSLKYIPSLIDGKMNPDEWIITGRGLLKIDFEQHNFGAPEYDVVDPAYDLAAACFQFRLSGSKEKFFLADYVNKTGDSTIYDRIILYKLLYGSIIRKKLIEEIKENNIKETCDQFNRRYLECRNFLVYSFNNFCSGLLKHEKTEDKNKFFFLDLDGVFDTEILGFPHTTISALKGISMLAERGYDVIPNTGRSINDVRNYCCTYDFNAGIGEYGSVIWDNLNKIEIPLTGSEIFPQLDICRHALGNIDNVFIDPSYKYSVRAYRFSSKKTAGLSADECKELISKHNLNNLKVINRQADTYFVGRQTDKGNAVTYFKRYSGKTNYFSAAIGDSDEDIPMFKSADKSYAPANCSFAVRKFAEQNKCHVVSKKNQQGLYSAVINLLNGEKIKEAEQTIDKGNDNTVHRILFSLLLRAEQPKALKIPVLLRAGKL